jgi:hypothetical protein
MTHPAAAPVASRAKASCGKVDTVPQMATSTAPMAQVSATVRYLPKRSASGPITSWTEPCVTA